MNDWISDYLERIGATRPGHMALRVRTPEPWLVDVAQGNHSRWPPRIDSPTPQDDPHGTYLLSQTPDGDIDVARNGELLYRMESRTRDEELLTIYREYFGIELSALPVRRSEPSP